jgi:hypothetical protein
MLEYKKSRKAAWKQGEKTADFKVGMRVRCNRAGAHYDSNEELVEGLEGTVCTFDDSYRVGVEFDEAISYHNCNGACKQGHGWYIPPRYLEYQTQSSLEEVKQT